ncbi:hypothetical protein W97_02462 [Coniosporium apollinis CBS 100218]|uniref:C2H2-type domain-containing protein n=1 Tax=Coniosporium apollinis (strain CBS 100218) TaxID=1168221 RepID=R7YMS5_CONA1|nr:uncharacterized protein W97_02462 [Coniosporium apollinis CBS 100218]EON63235.1 hypothetical protein W97_02462 [Coniosporium apollinis CBS 100218]
MRVPLIPHSNAEQEASEHHTISSSSNGIYYTPTTLSIGQDYSPAATPSTSYTPSSTCTSGDRDYRSADVNSDAIAWQTYSHSRPSGSRSHSIASTACQDVDQLQSPGYSFGQVTQTHGSGADFTYRDIADHPYITSQRAAEYTQQYSPQSSLPVQYSAATSFSQDPYLHHILPSYTAATTVSTDQLTSSPTRQRKHNRGSGTSHVTTTYQFATDYIQQHDHLAFDTDDSFLAEPFDQHSFETSTFPMTTTTSATSETSELQRSTSKACRGRRTSTPHSPGSSASNEVQHTCHCDASFKRAADLTRHRMSVHGENVILFDCDFPGCNRRGASGFKRKDHLNEHKRNVHNLYIQKREKGQRSARDPRPEEGFTGRGGY